MKIIVCLKHIADIAAMRDGDGAEPSVVRQVPNSLDLNALEEALQVRAAVGGEIIALTVGPAQADITLRKAVMMGADRAVRLWDESLRDLDAASMARVLAGAAKKFGFDLLLCGARSSDTGTELVGAMLAEVLEVPLICRAMALHFDGETGRIVADKKLEKGARETYATRLPAILTIEQGSEARYSGPNWIFRLRSERVEVLKLTDIGVTENLPVPRVRKIALMPPKPRTKVGTKVSGLSLKEKMAVMRGRSAAKPQRQAATSDRPEDAANKIKEHLDRWLS